MRIKQNQKILFVLLTLNLLVAAKLFAENPIVFVTQVPIPQDFATINAVFGNQSPSIHVSGRGGDLWIRYANGTLKNLTQAAGYGQSGLQGANSIQVRDPAVHWNAGKILFSMVIGAPTQQYQLTSTYWQLYEITGLAQNQQPQITKVPNQPTTYNNIMPVYDSNDNILFVSDRPLAGKAHTYPQRDEYESTATNTGLWRLYPSNGQLEHLDHAPSGVFNPIVDSFGRIIFSRWDHLQRDQQSLYPTNSYGAFDYQSEDSTVATSARNDVFPETRDSDEPDYNPNINLHSINQFFPWMMNQDGTGHETLNHIGRQELKIYSERSFNTDSNLQEFYSQYNTGLNQRSLQIFLQPREYPNHPGRYIGIACPEFGTHASGQIVSIDGPPGINPDHMLVRYLTHPDTSGISATPSAQHIGLSRDPFVISTGGIIASHSNSTLQDSNIGTSTNPQSRYNYRIKKYTLSGSYYIPGASLTGGISKSISYWSPDQLVSYNGPLWELQPVELVARTRPEFTSAGSLEAPEQSIFSELGVSLAEVTNYMRNNNLALVVSRNLTSRDKNDRQQPFNLRVFGTATENTPLSGIIYDIFNLQFFSGQLIRGYNGPDSPSAGRRVLARPLQLHSANLFNSNDPQGSVRIGSDGSMAAFVPARRALTWQVNDVSGTPIIRERYWVTFQPGEVRVCASCHGVNTADQSGNPAPTNPPQALYDLLSAWKGIPHDGLPDAPASVSMRVVHPQKLSVFKAQDKFKLNIRSNKNVILKLRIGQHQCSNSKSISSSSAKRILNGTIPQGISSRILEYRLMDGSSVAKRARARLTPQVGATAVSNSVLCNKLFRFR